MKWSSKLLSVVCAVLCFAIWPDSAPRSDTSGSLPSHASKERCIEIARGSAKTPGLPILCKRIDEAWNNPEFKQKRFEKISKASKTEKSEDSLSPADQLNALVVDFENKEVSSPHLSRLLAISDLIPPTFHAGVIIANANLSGPLVLSGVKLSTPVTFNKVTIPLEEIDFSLLRTDQVPEFNAAVLVVYSHFEKHIRFVDCIIEGMMMIQASKLDNGLNIEGTSFTEMNTENFLFIDRTTVDGGMLFRENRFDQKDAEIRYVNIKESDIKPFFYLSSPETHNRSSVFIRNNKIENLYTQGYFSGDYFVVMENDIGSIEIIFPFDGPESSATTALYIDSNRIENSLKAVLASDKETIDISGNIVGGSIDLKVVVPSDNDTSVDLTRNQVSGSGKFIFQEDPSKHESPYGVPSVVDLSSSRFEGPVYFEAKPIRPAAEKWTVKDKEWHLIQNEKGYSMQMTAESDQSKSAAVRNTGDGQETEAIAVHTWLNGWISDPAREAWSTKCPGDVTTDDTGKSKNLAELNLGSASFSELNWGFPFYDSDGDVIDCRFRWKGTGVRYDNWKTIEKSGPGFVDWHLSVSSEAERIDSLSFASLFLAERGRIVDSRDFQEEAKYRNYVKNPATGPEDLYELAMAFLLWPGGYGARPERALVLLAIFVGFFATVYRGYSWRYRMKQDRKEKATISEKSKAKKSELSEYETQVPGFFQFDKERVPRRFSALRFSLDAMLPVISLHAYDRYYPRSVFIRGLAALQHILGWWWVTVFLASAAIL